MKVQCLRRLLYCAFENLCVVEVYRGISTATSVQRDYSDFSEEREGASSFDENEERLDFPSRFSEGFSMNC